MDPDLDLQLEGIHLYRDKRDSITSKLEETLDQLRRSEQSAEHLQLQTSQLKVRGLNDSVDKEILWSQGGSNNVK